MFVRWGGVFVVYVLPGNLSGRRRLCAVLTL